MYYANRISRAVPAVLQIMGCAGRLCLLHGPNADNQETLGWPASISLNAISRSIDLVCRLFNRNVVASDIAVPHATLLMCAGVEKKVRNGIALHDHNELLSTPSTIICAFCTGQLSNHEGLILCATISRLSRNFGVTPMGFTMVQRLSYLSSC